MRRSLRAVWLWATAVVVALATALFVASDLAELHRRATRLGPERPVVVAGHDLAAGATVRASDLDVVHRHSSQAGDALAEPAVAIGRTVAVPVLAGQPVSDRHLAPRDRRGTTGVLAPGTRAVRVPDPDGLAPPPGAVVDVIVALDPALAEQVGAPTLVPAAGARVLAAGRPGDGSAQSAAGERTVLLLVPEEEAERLAFAVANGTVTLALAPPEDACCATSFSASSRG
jgi:Flp pilus assembly protein CpaB